MLRDIIDKTGIPFQKKILSLANYSPYIISNKLIFISGQLPLVNQKLLYRGKIGIDINEEKAKKSIQTSVLNLLSVLDVAMLRNNISLKSLKVLNIKGYLNVSTDFSNHSEIFNAASDILIDILGKNNGRHSRSVIGVNSLPLNSPVEIDGIFGFEK